MHDQFCGKSGTSVSKYGKALYPQLDIDIAEHFGRATTSFSYDKMVSFAPTTLCVEDCPNELSLNKDDRTYGGDDYPTDDDEDTPEFIYAYRTEEIFKRCLPTSNEYTVGDRVLCSDPTCTEAKAASLVSSCADVATTPGDDDVWEVCAAGVPTSTCTLQLARCEFKIQEELKASYRDPADTAGTTSMFTDAFATYLSATLSAYEACIKAWGVILILGVGVPVVLGFALSFALRLFAGIIVYSMLILTAGFMAALAIIFFVKAGVVDDSAIESVVGSVAINGTDIADTYNSFAQPADESLQAWYLTAAILMTIVTVVMMIWLCFQCDAIARCVAVIRETNKVLASLPMMLLFALVSIPIAVGVAALGFFGIYFFCYPYVTGDIESVWEKRSDSWSTMGMLLAYHLLITIWLWVVVIFLKQTITAHAVGYWFYEIQSPKGTGGSGCLGCGVLLKSVGVIIKHHLGSVIFGAAIVAIARLITLALGALVQARPVTSFAPARQEACSNE